MTNEDKLLELVIELQKVKKKIHECKLELNKELDEYYEWQEDKNGTRFYTLAGNIHNQKVFELHGLLREHSYGSKAWFNDYYEYCKEVEDLRKGLW